ncbi:MAG: hypothetical protein GAK45_02117 [Pseudomonas citronellolis]|nr:MAG: hypothetical protein GAK45_02117 [Pseudomonas citronellolis]
MQGGQSKDSQPFGSYTKVEKTPSQPATYYQSPAPCPMPQSKTPARGRCLVLPEVRYSTALTMSSMTFFASPKTIMVLSR